MTTTTELDAGAVLSVRNIGGIDEATVELGPGVNVLEGRNATNRTSLLRSIMAVAGSDNAFLKGDADEGSVELTVGDEHYLRTFERTATGVRTSGTPYLDDSTAADLFAFLLEDNEARRAVEHGDDLRDIIMRPVDTEQIEDEIRKTKRERDQVDDRIAEIDARAEDLPALTERKHELESEIAEVETDLADVREAIESANTSVEASQDHRNALEERIAAVSDLKSEIKDVRNQIESAREQRSALKEERKSLREEREEITTSIQEISDLGERIGKLQERKRSLDSMVERLQSVIQFNRDALEDDEALDDILAEGKGHVTDSLVADDHVVCWTCGTDVERDDIKGTIERLEDIRSEQMNERQDVKETLNELRERRQTVEKRQQRREQIDHQLERIEDHLQQQDERISSLEEQESELESDLAEAEAAVEDLEREENNEEILDLNEQANDLEHRLKNLRTERDDVEAEIEEIRAAIEERDDLKAERETLTERLAELRGRVESLESDAVEAFNKHMMELLDALEYRNIERIWIERKRTSERRKSSEFDLHVVRTSSGTAYEDTVDHLSESEREVTGLVFALAGYLVHRVHEDVPFILLDSLEAIDSERIASLVEYFSTYADYLVVALLPEDAQAIDAVDRRITSI